jgi:hypothetical protein
MGLSKPYFFTSLLRKRKNEVYIYMYSNSETDIASDVTSAKTFPITQHFVDGLNLPSAIDHFHG